MPTITVHIAPVGNPLLGGGTSLTGHMWFTLDDGTGDADTNGNTSSYGFSPRNEGEPHGDGEVKRNDDDHYLNPPYNYEKEISQEQYNAIQHWAEEALSAANRNEGRWAEYNGLFNACVDFTYQALHVGGLIDAPESGFQGNVFPWFNRWGMERDLMGQPAWWDNFIKDPVNTLYLSARNFIPRIDPLTLDLDGDGLETVGIDPNAPILFDHDGDGVKTASGWVNSDDAFLVYDRNGNGSIDSGQELFGDSTALYAGGTAADGFAALAQEDTNGDGLVNASDAHWSSLRLWRDLNQDGISQSSELFTLASQNIAALKVAKTANSQTLANGNQVADLGSFIKTDGSNGTLGEVTGMGDVNLANNPFYSDFTTPVPLTEAAQALPGMQGAGMVRDLREAASLDAVLVADVNGLTGLTHTQMQDQLDTLITHWAGTSAMNTSLTEAVGQGYTLAYLPSGMSITDYFTIQDSLAGISGSELIRLQTLQAQEAHLENLIGILERFNGLPYVTVSDTYVTTGLGQIQAVITDPDGIDGNGNPTSAQYAFVSLSAGQFSLLEQSYAQLKESIYGGLVLETRLKPYLDDISLTLDETGIVFDFSAMEAAMDALHATDPANALTDRLELVKYAGTTLADTGWGASRKIDTWISQAEAGGYWASLKASLATQRIILGSTVSDSQSGSSSDDVLASGAGNDTLSGGNGNDMLIGGGGNDQLYGDAGDDIYIFYKGDGADTVIDSGQDTGSKNVLIFSDYTLADLTLGWNGNDLLFQFSNGDMVTLAGYLYRLTTWSDQILSEVRFADGQRFSTQALISDFGIHLGDGNNTSTATKLDDKVFGDGGNDVISGGNGNDTLLGGTGNDRLQGESGNDTYIFHQGDGNDIVSDSGWNTGQTNVLIFSDYVLADLTLGRSGDHLLFQFANGDTVTLENYFYRLYWWNDQILSEVRFADGQSFGTQALLNTIGVHLGDGNTTATFTNLDDKVFGDGGDDVIYGVEGNDTLLGGTGNDRLQGDGGNDTYIFRMGDGNDIVSDSGWNTGQTNVLIFSDYVLADLTLGRSGNHLLFQFANGDTVTLENYFYRLANWNDQILSEVRFADGQSFGTQALLNTIGVHLGDADTTSTFTKLDDKVFGDGGSDVIYGGEGNDTLSGGTGNDQLYGDSGNDTLSGGTGNDRLQGDGGNDTYIFHQGDGNDVVSDSGLNSGQTNVLTFSDYVLADLTLGRSGNHLLFQFANGDTVTLENYFYRLDWYGDQILSEVHFADGQSFGAQALINTIGVHLGDADNTSSFVSLDDKVFGDGGNDVIYGGSGNDTLSGGTGNDRLQGDSGNDTFIFRMGDGNDIVSDSGWNSGQTNVLTFSDYVLADLTLGRSGNHLLFQFANGDTVTLENYFYRMDWYSDQILSEVRFADGQSFGTQALLNTIGVHLGNADNNSTFTSLDDKVFGDGGNDLIYAGSGNDTLSGGTGNDRLQGDSGNDTFIFHQGDGNDIVSDWGWNSGQTNVLTFSDYVLADLTLGRSGNHLLFQFANGDTVTLENYFYRMDWYSDQILSEVRFADGQSFGMQALINNIGIHTVYGGSGNDSLNGYAGNDYLFGNIGDDVLNGNTGNDILEGGDGNDTLTDTSGVALFNGGAGTDTITGGTAAEIYRGGLGNDTYTTGAGNDVILFNKGDGQDVFSAGGTGSDTLSLGGNFAYSDLLFSKSSNDLVLKVGTSDQLIFRDWYAATPSKPVVNLQVIAEAMSGFVAGGNDPLLDQKVEQFNFTGLVGAFDTARAANTELNSWALTDALTSFQLAGSDTAAIGGDLAYQYGQNSTLAGIGVTAAQTIIGDASFGAQAQILQPLPSLQTGAVRLT